MRIFVCSFFFLFTLVTEPALGIGLLEENFDSAVPPPGWTVDNNGQPGTWEQRPASDYDAGAWGNAEGFCATADSNIHPGQIFDTDLITPSFDCSAYGRIYLDYDFNFDVHDANESGAVDISTDSGASWTNLITYTEDTEGDQRIDISPHASGQSTVRLRYSYDTNGQFWKWQFAVDNVAVNAIFPPEARANGPYGGSVGEIIQLEASGSSDPDGMISSYQWSINGNIYTGVNPSVDLSGFTGGTYAVVLTVTDTDRIQDTDTTTLRVVGQQIPTLNEWGMILTMLVLVGAAAWQLRRRGIPV
jgi:hypothetical protein